MPSWMSKGADAIAQKAKEGGGDGADDFLVPDRFWMPYSTTKDTVFVDDEGCGVYEHSPFIGGTRKGHWFTCPEAGSECCEEFGSSYKDRYLIVWYTVVDCSEWEDSRGNKHQYYVKLFGAKYGTYEKLSTKKAEEGGFAGKMVRARRFKQQMEPGVGSEHNILRPVESQEGLFKVARYKGKLLSEMWDEAEQDEAKMETLRKLFSVQFDEDGKLVREVPPFNYDFVLRPPSEDHIRDLIERANKNSNRNNGSGGGGGSSNEAGDSFAEDEDIPF